MNDELRMDESASDAISPRRLRNQALLFSKYLLDVKPTEQLIDRYIEANARLFTDPPSPREARLFRTLERAPWLLSILDAPAAYFEPDGLLRRKLLLMAAILEATPEHAEKFLAATRSPMVVLARCAWALAIGSFKFALGLPVYFLVRGVSA